jgi:hypothetical protein
MTEAPMKSRIVAAWCLLLAVLPIGATYGQATPAHKIVFARPAARLCKGRRCFSNQSTAVDSNAESSPALESGQFRRFRNRQFENDGPPARGRHGARPQLAITRATQS